VIGTLLVANRGEVALRIMATAQGLGIRTVAVHPADDADCAHVAAADEAVLLPGSGPRAYLSVDAVMAAVRTSRADAVHPGYGFLSEDPVLARACRTAGVAFVGPSPDALDLFGDKTATRARAVELGLPVLAATESPTSLDEATRLLDERGAVMVKARAGGGGRGLRPVSDVADLAAAMRQSASEAAAAFGDDGVFVEALLAHARHVEVQVIGDGATVAVLGDRDCSVQRRRQKLVEIAPAPGLSRRQRGALHAAAERLIGSISYCGLATVEFLVHGPDHYLLEVNPRLQVEHTVTEEVTGLDLVALSLGVADGATLTDIGVADPPSPSGSAVEVRVNAETIATNGDLRPSGGTLTRFDRPSGRGVRVDSHGYVGYAPNPRYDSLLAKVITAGHDPAEAIARATKALGDFAIDGVDTGIALLLQVLAEPGLTSGGLDTDWLDSRSTAPADADGADAPQTGPDEDAVVAPLQGTLVSLAVGAGHRYGAGAELAVVEAMKMEHVVRASRAGVVREVLAEPGQAVTAGTVLFAVDPIDADDVPTVAPDIDPDHIRADLAEAIGRHRIGLDEGRPDVVEQRHATGRRTARENIADLVDAGSFVEYGALTIAAQRRRRTLEDLIERTPADGLVMGTATVAGRAVAVMAYDYTVLAGTV
jgi:acetyl/propionyl-CoA carboxylase alpha subunit